MWSNLAPKIFKDAKFSKGSDIYSLGMIMWELTTGCKPFANVKKSLMGNVQKSFMIFLNVLPI